MIRQSACSTFIPLFLSSVLISDLGFPLWSALLCDAALVLPVHISRRMTRPPPPLPVSSLQTPFQGIFLTRPVSFPSVHVNLRNQTFYCYSSSCGTVSNCPTRTFSGISLHRRKVEQMIDRLQEKDKHTTQHERAFIVLCIYAIVYV